MMSALNTLFVTFSPFRNMLCTCILAHYFCLIVSHVEKSSPPLFACVELHMFFSFIAFTE